MSSYIYSVFERDPETFENEHLVYNSTKKWGAKKYLENVLASGDSIANFYVHRSRDSIAGTGSIINVYEFMEIDLGEVL